ncbi:MAG: sel1 repeat family protein [Alphaproteobacteria bacterium]|nr:sel1 repeat family protein [Alphaproteobacteria bacterium]
MRFNLVFVVGCLSLISICAHAATPEQIYQQALDGQSQAQFQWAEYLRAQPNADYRDIVAWLTKAAQQGYMEAQFALGKIYQYGRPLIAQDVYHAEYWYKKAAAQGDKQAEQEIAKLKTMPVYKLDAPVTTDEAWEIEWLRKSAQMGDSESQYQLGTLYQNGKLPKNDKKALAWYYQSAQQGNLPAMRALGFMYYTGQGTPAREDLAIKWYTQAAEQDDPIAQRKLYEIYLIRSQEDRAALITAYVWLYLSVEFAFPHQTNLEQNAPELNDLAQQMTPDERQVAQQQIQLFLDNTRYPRRDR